MRYDRGQVLPRLLDPQFAEFAVKGRPADLQAPRDFGHAAAIMADGKADQVGFDLFHRPDMAVGAEQRHAADLAGGRDGRQVVIGGCLGGDALTMLARLGIDPATFGAPVAA